MKPTVSRPTLLPSHDPLQTLGNLPKSRRSSEPRIDPMLAEAGSCKWTEYRREARAAEFAS